MTKSTKTPNPGSPEAIVQKCVCPRIDNRHGLGAYEDEDGNPLFWISGNCPIHGQGVEKVEDETT